MRTRNFLAATVFGAVLFCAPTAVFATGAGDGSSTCTVTGPVRCEGGDSSGGTTGDTLPPKVRPPAPTSTVPQTVPVTTVPVTVPVTTVPQTTTPPGVPEQNQVAPGVPQENQVLAPGTPEQTQVSPGNAADTVSNASSGTAAAGNSSASSAPGKPKSSSTSERVSKSTIQEATTSGTQAPMSVTTLLTQTTPTMVIDPSDGPSVAGTKVVAASRPSVLNHFWPESILAGLVLGATAYGAVVVSRRRSERSLADEDLEMFLMTSQEETTSPEVKASL